MEIAQALILGLSSEDQATMIDDLEKKFHNLRNPSAFVASVVTKRYPRSGGQDEARERWAQRRPDTSASEDETYTESSIEDVHSRPLSAQARAPQDLHDLREEDAEEEPDGLRLLGFMHRRLALKPRC
eukprot:s187_g8.t1